MIYIAMARAVLVDSKKLYYAVKKDDYKTNYFVVVFLYDLVRKFWNQLTKPQPCYMNLGRIYPLSTLRLRNSSFSFNSSYLSVCIAKVQRRERFPRFIQPSSDRKSVVQGKSVKISVDLGGRRIREEEEHVRRYMYLLEMQYSNTWQVLQREPFHSSYEPVMVPALWVRCARGSGPGHSQLVSLRV